MADKNLTDGHDVMYISIELLRLGSSFESESMQDYGRELLASYLGELLDHLCDTNATNETKKDRFNKQAGFPKNFCQAVRNSYDTEQPVKPAQDILADFAFAARIHLFKNPEFVAFIKTKEIPEFGNLVLTAQMTGSVSGSFKDNSTFKKWQDWRLNPPSAPANDPICVP
jgi:hypothetical protein